MLAKSHDYSSGGDHFRNFRGASKLGIDPVKGVLLRIQDKLERINTFVDEGTLSVKEESCLDSVLDIVNYIIIAQMLINERLDDVEYHKAQEEEAKKEQIAPQGE